LERNVGEVLRSMAQLFQLRNIYCHELAQGPPPAVLEMEGLLNHAQFHLVLSEMVIAPLLSERLEVRAKIKRTKTVPQAEVRRRAKRGKAARDALLDSGTSPDGRTHSGCA
jgi:hypothetical protein